MSTKIKLLVWLFLITTIFIFSSCEKELYDDKIYQSKIKIEKISLKSNESKPKIDPNLFKAVSKFKNRNFENNELRIVFDSITGIYFDDEIGMKISDDNYESYSFKIINSIGNLENVLFNKNAIGQYDVFKIEYDFTEEEMKNLSQQEIENSPKIISELITQSNGFVQVQERCTVTFEIETIASPRDDGDPDGPNATHIFIFHFHNCGGGGGSSSSSSSGTPIGGNPVGGNPSGGTPTGGNPSSGTPSGGTPSGGTPSGGTPVGGNPSGGTPIGGTPVGGNPSGGTPTVVTTPLYTIPVTGFEPDCDGSIDCINTNKFRLFKLDLLPTQSAILNNNPTLNTSIYNYLSENDFSSESEIFARQFIDACIANPTLNLDIESSTKSPFFVDLSSVIGNTPENIKFREVYTELTQSVGFKNLFTDMFGTTPLFNVKFVIEELTPLPPNNQIPDGLCTAYRYPNDLAPFNIIRIDKSKLLEKSKINLAIVILHECIHAYLNIKLLNPVIGMTIPGVNDLDIQTCINTYYNSFSGQQTQHSFFVDFMIPLMTQILLDIKDNLTTPVQINELENPTNGAAILYAPTGNPPTISDVQIPWNWQDCFNYLSYTGLENCTSYPFHYPVQNIADYHNFQYFFAFNAIFNP